MHNYHHSADGCSTGTPKSTPTKGRHIASNLEFEPSTPTTPMSGLWFEGDAEMEENSGIEQYAARNQGSQRGSEASKAEGKDSMPKQK
jgi:hypothetical protein